MIILDTNVISELMRVSPEPAVLVWLRARPLDQLATTTISVAEVGYGLARLPFGRRRHDLEIRFSSFLSTGFANRVFDFDRAAAEVYGDLAVARQRAGRPLEGFDGLIAAIAKSRGAAIATRNTDDFAGCEIALMNPWSASSPSP